MTEPTHTDGASAPDPLPSFAPPDAPPDAAAAPAPNAVPMPPPAPGAPKRRRNYSRWVVGILAPMLAVVIFAGGVAVGNAASPSTPGTTASTSPNSAGPGLGLIDEAWRAIHDNYVDAKDLNDKDLIYGAIRGMTDAVGDEGHTSFMTADEAKAVDQSLSGSFVGIGVQVDTDASNGPIIRSVIPNTPAEEAGLQRGDKIVAVDGKSTAGQAIDEVVSEVRGPEGEKVTLSIERGTKQFDVTITRRKFELPLVSWAMVPGRDVALIRLDQFATGATDGVKNAITQAKDAGAKSIVFDLRGNPGGYVNEAVGVASQFLSNGIVYRAIDKTGTEKDAQVQPGGLATNIPIVVLADGSTASSAEIVTGALQDAKRAEVVGQKTFGTGTVLGRFDLSDGSSLRIGVERWLTRNGRPIWHEGLDPDFPVALPDNVNPVIPSDLKGMTPAELAKSPDVQLLKALDLLKGNG